MISVGQSITSGLPCRRRLQAQHLLNAADHYALPNLLIAAENFLGNHLSVNNVALTLTLAEQHHANRLRERALLFAAANAVAVADSEGWDHLVRSRPSLLRDLMKTQATGKVPPPEKRAAAEGQEAEEGDEGGGRSKQARTS